jgi:hypothetical protein
VISSKRIRLMETGKTYSGILDTLGNVDNCVMGFSLYRLTSQYEGYCLRVVRASDSQTLDIGFVDGYIDIDSLETFCAGTDGYVDIWYNQSQSSSITNALQTTPGYRPKIVNSGSFLINGLKFDGSDDIMNVVSYPAIDITNSPLTTYLNYYNNNAHSGFYFAKYIGSSAFNIQYCLQSITSSCRIFMNGSFGRVITTAGHNVTGLNKTMTAWQGTGTNEFKIKSLTGLGQNTINGTLTSYNTFNIGGWSTNFADANIKTLLIFNSDEYSKYDQLVANI